MGLSVFVNAISGITDHWNALATICALVLSTGSLIIQYIRSKREVGKLEVTEVKKPNYMILTETVYGTNPSETSFSVRILGRNSRDGVLRIYDVEADVRGLDDEMHLEPDDGFPITVEARDELDTILGATKSEVLDLGDSVDGVIMFETSNNDPVIQTTFEKRH